MRTPTIALLGALIFVAPKAYAHEPYEKHQQEALTQEHVEQAFMVLEKIDKTRESTLRQLDRTTTTENVSQRRNIHRIRHLQRRDQIQNQRHQKALQRHLDSIEVLGWDQRHDPPWNVHDLHQEILDSDQARHELQQRFQTWK